MKNEYVATVTAQLEMTLNHNPETKLSQLAQLVDDLSFVHYVYADHDAIEIVDFRQELGAYYDLSRFEAAIEGIHDPRVAYWRKEITRMKEREGIDEKLRLARQVLLTSKDVKKLYASCENLIESRRQAHSIKSELKNSQITKKRIQEFVEFFVSFGGEISEKIMRYKGCENDATYLNKILSASQPSHQTRVSKSSLLAFIRNELLSELDVQLGDEFLLSYGSNKAPVFFKKQDEFTFFEAQNYLHQFGHALAHVLRQTNHVSSIGPQIQLSYNAIERNQYVSAFFERLVLHERFPAQWSAQELFHMRLQDSLNLVFQSRLCIFDWEVNMSKRPLKELLKKHSLGVMATPVELLKQVPMHYLNANPGLYSCFYMADLAARYHGKQVSKKCVSSYLKSELKAGFSPNSEDNFFTMDVVEKAAQEHLLQLQKDLEERLC